jgi:hypothetical protein
MFLGVLCFGYYEKDDINFHVVALLPDGKCIFVTWRSLWVQRSMMFIMPNGDLECRTRWVSLGVTAGFNERCTPIHGKWHSHKKNPNLVQCWVNCQGQEQKLSYCSAEWAMCCFRTIWVACPKPRPMILMSEYSDNDSEQFSVYSGVAQMLGFDLV